MTATRILICGSRTWTNPEPISFVLESAGEGSVIIHGAARGADHLADTLARQLGLEVEAYPAYWETEGQAAGPRRNQRMLDRSHPDVVWAFKTRFDWTLRTGGTEHMAFIAARRGIPTFVVSAPAGKKLAVRMVAA